MITKHAIQKAAIENQFTLRVLDNGRVDLSPHVYIFAAHLIRKAFANELLSNEQIKALALGDGFKEKQTPAGVDIAPYIYSFARSVMKMVFDIDAYASTPLVTVSKVCEGIASDQITTAFSGIHPNETLADFALRMITERDNAQRSLVNALLITKTVPVQSVSKNVDSPEATPIAEVSGEDENFFGHRPVAPVGTTETSTSTDAGRATPIGLGLKNLALPRAGDYSVSTNPLNPEQMVFKIYYAAPGTFDFGDFKFGKPQKEPATDVDQVIHVDLTDLATPKEGDHSTAQHPFGANITLSWSAQSDLPEPTNDSSILFYSKAKTNPADTSGETQEPAADQAKQEPSFTLYDLDSYKWPDVNGLIGLSKGKINELSAHVLLERLTRNMKNMNAAYNRGSYTIEAFFLSAGGHPLHKPGVNIIEHMMEDLLNYGYLPGTHSTPNRWNDFIASIEEMDSHSAYLQFHAYMNAAFVYLLMSTHDSVRKGLYNDMYNLIVVPCLTKIGSQIDSKTLSIPKEDLVKMYADLKLKEVVNFLQPFYQKAGQQIPLDEISAFINDANLKKIGRRVVLDMAKLFIKK